MIGEIACEVLLPSWRSTQPPMVVVHGAGRQLVRLRHVFGPLAERSGAAVAFPHLAAPAFAGYQRLAGADGHLGASDAMDRLLDRLGWAAAPLDLVGVSGGAQFVHRYVMVGRARVRRAVLLGAGWYTMLDADRPFPHGVGVPPGWGQRSIDADRVLALPIHLLVGARDTGVGGRLRDDPHVAAQGRTRLDRAHAWHAHLREEAARRGVASRATLDVVPGARHGFGDEGMRERIRGRVAAALSAGPNVSAAPADRTPRRGV